MVNMETGDFLGKLINTQHNITVESVFTVSIFFFFLSEKLKYIFSSKKSKVSETIGALCQKPEA